MPSGTPRRDRAGVGVRDIRIRSRLWTRLGRELAPKTLRAGKDDGRGADREAHHDGVAHVVATHRGMGHADRQSEGRDQSRGDDTQLRTSKFPAEYQRHVPISLQTVGA